MWARSSRRSVHVAFLRQWVERQLLISWRYGRADGSVEILSELFLISPLRSSRIFFEQRRCGIAAVEPFSVLMGCLPQLIFGERLYKMGNGKHAANAYYKLEGEVSRSIDKTGTTIWKRSFNTTIIC